ncbi:MAG: adenosine deaminase family protein, partial [Deltaproteobacteria bacterium]|nr:adenosine deaminase family protein [Deltaproteobacteria bacterium]
DRIGHGTNLFDISLVDLPTANERERYVHRLSEYIADRRITIEVCLTSNMQTIPSLQKLEDHAFKKMLEEKLSTTICTDNRLVSHTTVTEELVKAVEHFHITPNNLRNLIIYGFKRSFFFGNYTEKREYVRSVINRYELLEKQFGVVRTKAVS